MSTQPVVTPITDLLRSVHPDASVHITEPSGWSYYSHGLGGTLHEAADLIDKLQGRNYQGIKCESCTDEARYSSSHWLKSGGMIVLYWCEMHALKDADSIEKDEA